MYYVYRYMIGDQWIYVGKSAKNLKSRVNDHARDPRFSLYHNAVIEYCELNTKSDMDITESMLIKTMHPLINVVDSTDGSVPFEYNECNIKWLPYDMFKSTNDRKHSKANALSIPYTSAYKLVSDFLDKDDPLNLRSILPYWCRIFLIEYADVCARLCIDTNCKKTIVSDRLNKAYKAQCIGNRYFARVFVDGNDLRFIVCLLPDGELVTHQMYNTKLYLKGVD